MDILSYLSELIQTRNAVGISGLGTIFKTKIPGRYDAATHSFIPPGYKLDFTAEVKEEVLFADYISKNRNISIETARYFISDFTERTLQQLNEQEQIAFGKLGTLSRVNNELKFEPAEDVNYGFDFFGLPPVKAEQEHPAEEIIFPTPTVEEHPESGDTTPVSTDEEDLEKTADDPAPVSAPEEVQPPAEETTSQPVVLHEEDQYAAPAEETAAHVKEPLDEDTVEEENSPAPAIEQYNETAEEEDAPLSPTEEPILKSIIAEQKSPYLKATGHEIEEMVWKANENREKENTAAPIAETAPASPITPVPFPPAVPSHVYPSQDGLQEEETKSTPLYLKVIIAVALLAALVAITYYLKPELFNNQSGNTPPQKIPAKSQSAPAAPVDSTLVTDTSSTADTVNKNVADTTAAAKKTTPVTVTKAEVINPADTAAVYEIIGASMLNQKEADNFIRQMQKSGVKAKVVTNMAGKRLKMSIATLKDEASAKEEQKRLYEKLKIEGTYIYRNKQK